ncbi:GGDEF domain-containing protein [Shimia sp. R9_3]|uniref:GGDEF domain-containing protein n=1 Tax=Shimia sp. R9_3 TaxID=2821113 RepID=UPI001ADB451F|nr:GGDEF domain-containing protein [Shimia sp. R9_3]MBO9399913.1 GGDEF domain-containing protein [Shimia sp. R9_3]
MSKGFWRVNIKNSRDRWILVFVVTVTSLIGSLALTSVLSPTGLSPQALLPSVTVPLIVAPLASHWAAKKMWRVYELNRELARILAHDSLSGLLNRAAFFDLFASDTALGRGAILLVDIDSFKAINQNHGHKIGDQVIAMVAQVLKVQTAAGGYAARVGSAQFAVFLPDDRGRAPLDFAERIRSAVEQEALPADQGSVSCTVSIGVEYREGDEDIDSAMRRADQGLSAAQDAGHNRVRQYQYLALV